MKYLKKFNEELKPHIYRKAAGELKKIGHTRRSDELEKWADKVQLDIDKAEQKEVYDRLSKYPSFELELRKDTWDRNTKSIKFGNEPMIKGNFYLDASFEEDMFNDQYHDWLGNNQYGFSMFFIIGIFPADDETRIKFDKLDNEGGLSEETWNGVYWPCWMGLRIAENNSNEFKVGGVSWDSRNSDQLLFSNRKEAFKFKKLFSDAIDCKNKFGEGKWSKDGVGGDLRERFELTEEEQVIKNCWIRQGDTLEEIEEKKRKEKEVINGRYLTPKLYEDIKKGIRNMSLNSMYRN